MLNNNDSLLIDDCFRTLKRRAMKNERGKNTNTRATNKKNIIKLLTMTNRNDDDGDGDDAEINDANAR